MAGSFFDTNVLIYAPSGDEAKADRVEELIAGGGTISVQVLNEVTTVARRKIRLSWSETRAFLSVVRGLLPIQAMTIPPDRSLPPWGGRDRSLYLTRLATQDSKSCPVEPAVETLYWISLRLLSITPLKPTVNGPTMP